MTATDARVDEAEPGEAAFLSKLGERVRQLRARHGMTRKALARESGVSERYLAQLESGRGNISILLLRQIAEALSASLEELVGLDRETNAGLSLAIGVLQRLSPDNLETALRWLTQTFLVDGGEGRGRIALMGLKGAGKSTIGRVLAARLDVPFIELDDEIKEAAGLPLSDLFDLYGQAGFRRLERQALERVIANHPSAVIAVGGGLVSDAEAFGRLLANCYTVWLRATPAEHMARVVAQGDLRPMADNREAMSDLERILEARARLYSRSDVQVSTSGRTVEQCVDEVLVGIGR